MPANDSAALAAKPFDLLGIDSITFISCQSYGNSFPQPRHATYVPVSWAAGESRWPGRFVIGKLKFLWLQPNRTSSRLAIIHHPQLRVSLEGLTCRLRQECTTGHVLMYISVHVPRTVTLDSEYLKKVRRPTSIIFLTAISCRKYTYIVYVNDNEWNIN